MNIKLPHLFFSLAFIFSATFLSAENKKNDLLFIENAGQIKDLKGNVDASVLYMIRSNGINIYITKNGLKYQFIKDNNNDPFTQNSDKKLTPNYETQSISMNLLGINPDAEIMALDKAVFTEFYYSSHQNIKANSFKKIIIKNIYNGIDWVLYSVNGKLKYDFIVNIGADYHQIKMKYEGVNDLKILADKSLNVKTAMGNIIENAPFTFTEKTNTEIKSKFILQKNIITFDLKNTNNNTEKIVIDPGLEWATYYGGDGSEEARGTVVDSKENVYLSGITKSYNNISTTGSHQDAWSGNYDMFLVKMDKDGNRIWATYYGDGGNDFAQSLAIDSDDNIYLGGDTYSDFNMTSNGHQNDFGGDIDGILIKFNSDGTRLWATYYGGNSYDGIQTVAIDKNNNVYIAGSTLSDNDMATSGSFHEEYIFDYGFADSYLAKFDSSGTRQWATYFGGSYDDYISSIKTDTDGNVYIAGYTESDDSIFYNGSKNNYEGYTDGFIAKFDTDGNIIWSTYYGGTQYDLIYAMEIDRDNNLYVTGYTRSYNGISKNGFKNTRTDFNQYSDAFLSKFSSSGNLIWATYYGGEDDDYGNGLATDEYDNIYLCGTTKSTKEIGYNGLYNTNGGSDDGFLVKFDKNGGRKWSTFYGGKATIVNNFSFSGQDNAYAIYGDKKGHVYISGYTLSDNRISFNGHQNATGGNTDSYLAKFFTERIYVENISKNLCVNEKIEIDLNQTINMQFGNTIRVEQSSVNGNFANQQLLTTINDSLKGIKNISVNPVGTFNEGDYVLIRFVTSAPADTIYAADTIFLHALPSNNLQASLNEFCADSSTILQASVGTNYTYEWYKNDTLLNETLNAISVNKAGTYKVKISNNNCSNISNEEIIIVNPLPEIPVINRSGKVLTTGIFDKYQWYKNNQLIPNAEAQNYTVTEDGDYKVRVENEHGCSSMSGEINVMVSSITNVDARLANIYPVPTTSILNIDALENCKMNLMDMNGKTLMNQDLIAGNTVINLSEFAAGIYIIRLQNASKTSELKIVKE